MTLLFLTLIATAVLAGVREGMIMILPNDPMWDRSYPNVRGHVWFDYYHAIRIATVAGYAILGWWLISHFVTTWQYLVTLCLVAVIANDLFEYGYSYARFKTLINIYPESFNIADVMKFHVNSKMMHTIRLMLIVILIGIMVA